MIEAMPSMTSLVRGYWGTDSGGPTLVAIVTRTVDFERPTLVEEVTHKELGISEGILGLLLQSCWTNAIGKKGEDLIIKKISKYGVFLKSGHIGN